MILLHLLQFYMAGVLLALVDTAILESLVLLVLV